MTKEENKSLRVENSFIILVAAIGIGFTCGWKWFWLALFVDACISFYIALWKDIQHA